MRGAVGLVTVLLCIISDAPVRELECCGGEMDLECFLVILSSSVLGEPALAALFELGEIVAIGGSVKDCGALLGAGEAIAIADGGGGSGRVAGRPVDVNEGVRS